MRPKISVIGAGNVGRECAAWCAIRELGDIVLWNRTQETAVGTALDLMEAGPLVGFDASIEGTGNIMMTKNSDIVIVTAGLPRKPGMKREELVTSNAQILTPLLTDIAKYSPKSILIMLTNPLDAMAYLALHVSKFPRERVIGMAGILDSSRFASFIAKDLRVSIHDVSALVLGSHGENMVPLPRFATVGGVPLFDLLSEKRVAELAEHTKNAGAEIVELLTANASFSVGAAAARLVESIVRDEKQVLPCSTYLKGEYGQNDVFIGVPCVVGEKGIEKIVKLRLNTQEKELFANAAARIKEMMQSVKL